MDTLTTLLSEQTIERIGWVLIHFLWQGIAVMLLSWCVLKTLRKASANARYIAACASLVLMVAAPVATFVILAPDAPLGVADVQMPDALSVSPAAAPVQQTRTIVLSPAAESIPLPAPSLIETATAQLEAVLPYCVIGWIVGVAILSVWYLGGWCQLQKLRRIKPQAADLLS